MFDEKFYEDVFNFTFDYEKFYREKKDLKCIKYDTCDASKYYNLDRIKIAFDKLLNKEIDCRYFAHWCNAYNWIITADIRTKDRTKVIKNYVFSKISWELDGLSFTDKPISVKQAKEWIEEFVLLDDIYRSNDWKAFYAPAAFADYNDDQYVLFYNDIKSLFTVIYMDHITNGYEEENLVYLSEEELVEKLKYYEKNYFFFEYSEVKYMDSDIKKILKKAKKVKSLFNYYK